MTRRWLIVSLLLYLGAREASTGVMDNFGDGLKVAGQMFGINTAADVANLVAKAFSGKNPQPMPNLINFMPLQWQTPRGDKDEEDQEDQSNQETETENAQEEPSVDSSTRRPPPKQGFDTVQMFTNMMRMVGFDTRKLGALALNAIIMVAQAIGSTIMQATRGGASLDAPEALYEQNESQPRSLPISSPIDWFLQREDGHSKRLLQEIMDRELPERIVDMISEKEDPEKGHKAGCMKLLMCKSQPIIWGMQDSLKKRIAGEPEEQEDTDSFFNKKVFYKYLPSLEDFREHSTSCEARFHEECPRNATTGGF
ncbi:uncharacterized protein [Drosophila bipectinata]|uniref:uncharacterized protein n=1 Tax=Drosophila bipectinata TaxID=42026 RepID=UPI001C8ABDC6|nr:uncharacterized protein LOC108128398 [Drosophila bipectinata]